MPMLAEVKTSRPPIEYGSLSAFWIRNAIAFACCGSLIAFSRIANSSPPRRASASPCRRHDSSRRDTAVSSSSPTMWPRLSLTTLKRSRSR